MAKTDIGCLGPNRAPYLESRYELKQTVYRSMQQRHEFTRQRLQSVPTPLNYLQKRSDRLSCRDVSCVVTPKTFLTRTCAVFPVV